MAGTENVDHGSRAHALLSASGASRWLNCPPSARLEEKFDESAQSSYAAEGELAHELAELELMISTERISEKVYNSELKRIKSNPHFSSEMPEQVDKYVNIVLETYAEARKISSDATLSIEERLDFSTHVENGFGTGDSVIAGDNILYIDDLKYGKGIRVDAQNNPQLRLYALGAYNNYSMMYDIKEIRMSIIQPRLDHYSTETISVRDLIVWADRTVRPNAQKAYSGKGVQKAGDWCKWCKVKPMCATLAAQNIKLAQMDFADPHLLRPGQIVDVYKQIPMLVDWAQSVAKYMLQEAVNGTKWKGFKVVEGTSKRRWSNVEAVEKKLTELGYTPDQYQKASLKGLGDIQKLVTTKTFNKDLKPLVVKPQGSPTLVPESDKRPAMGLAQAEEDFSEKLEQ